MHQKETLKCDNFYSVFNQGLSADSLFLREDDYLIFLRQFSEMLFPVADLFGYCLVPNQFYLLIKIKSEREVFTFLKQNGKFPDETITLDSIKTLSEGAGVLGIDVLGTHLTKLFTAFFSAYIKSNQAQVKRKTANFERGFSAKLLSNLGELKVCISAIHNRPLAHNLVVKMEDWKYSSYAAILSDKPTKLKREEVISWFENRDNFIQEQQQKLASLLEYSAS